MADELEDSRLIVTKSKDGTYNRIVESENPQWYKQFCAKYQSTRKDGYRWKEHKTSIKRRETLIALRNIAAGKTRSTPNQYSQSGGYIPMLVPIIEKELEKRKILERQIEQDERVPF